MLSIETDFDVLKFSNNQIALREVMIIDNDYLVYAYVCVLYH